MAEPEAPSPAALEARIAALESALAASRAAAEAYASRQAAAERLAQEQAVLAEIGRVVDATPDIAQVYERFAAIVRTLIPFDTLSVNVVDPQKSSVRLAYVSGAPIPGLTDAPRLPLAGTMTGYVLARRRAMILQAATVEEAARLYPEITRVTSFKAGFRAHLMVPLFVGDQGIGVLHFRMRSADAYGEADLRLAERVGMQIAGAIANAQLYVRLRESRGAAERLAQEQALLAEIGRIVSTTLDIDEVYERFAAAAGRLIPFDRIVVNLNRPETNERCVAYVSGLDVPVRRQGSVASLAGSTNEALIHTRQGVILHPRSEAEIPPHFESLAESFAVGLRSFLSVPLFAGDAVIGALHFRSRTPDLYGQEALRLAGRISDQIAGAIANAQLYARLQESQRAAERLAREQATLAAIGRIVSTTLDINEVYERFAAEVRTLIPFDRIVVNLNLPATRELCVAYAAGTEPPMQPLGTVVPLAGSINEELLRTRKGFFLHPKSVEEIPARFVRPVKAFQMGIRSFLSVPLIASDRVIGALHFRAQAPDLYDGETLRLAERIGDQIAGAIANAQLYARLEESQRATQRLAEEQTVLAGIGRVIGDCLSLEEVYERFAAEIGKLIHYDRLMITLTRGGDGAARVNFATGLPLRGRATGNRFPLAGSISETVLQRRAGLLITEAELPALAERYATVPELTELGIRSFLSVPLLFKQEVVGVCHFRSRRPNAYSEADLQLLEKISAQISGAVVSAELHDELQRAQQALQRHLENLESLVQARTVELEEINTALRVLIRKREEDQSSFVENIQSNINHLVIPFLEKLRACDQANRQSLSCLTVLETNLLNIVSPFMHHLSSAFRQLTPKELQIAELIRQGKSSKEIAHVLALSLGTVVSHRNNIRKKLRLPSREVNLRSHLLSLGRPTP